MFFFRKLCDLFEASNWCQVKVNVKKNFAGEETCIWEYLHMFQSIGESPQVLEMTPKHKCWIREGLLMFATHCCNLI